jgi:hypothetical protein
MGKLIPASDAAASLGMSSERLRVLCRERRISGARCIAGRWFVPDDVTLKAVAPRARGPALGSRK